MLLSWLMSTLPWTGSMVWTECIFKVSWSKVNSLQRPYYCDQNLISRHHHIHHQHHHNDGHHHPDGGLYRFHCFSPPGNLIPLGPALTQARTTRHFCRHHHRQCDQHQNHYHRHCHHPTGVCSLVSIVNNLSKNFQLLWASLCQNACNCMDS